MHIRRTVRRDAVGLRRFKCAGESWFEREVQEFVNGPLAEQVARGRRALVIEDEGEVIAVADYEAAPDPSGNGLIVGWLKVAALREDRQGTSLQSGGRLSDVLMAALVASAAQASSDGKVAGYVAHDNVRSRAMCARAGMVEDPESDVLTSLTLNGPAAYVMVYAEVLAHRSKGST
jgi:RimJ/RimL family protein N-acetyltransferase